MIGVFGCGPDGRPYVVQYARQELYAAESINFCLELESAKGDADRVRVTTNHLLQVAILDLF